MNAHSNYPVAMVIDDEAFMRKLVAVQLRSLGCKSVICHESGVDALSTLTQRAEDIKLILCDLQMPGMDGIEVLRRLALIGYGGALILVSGEDNLTLAMARKLANAHGLHVLGALQKPVQPDQLKEILSTLHPATIGHTRPDDVRRFSSVELAAGIKAGQLVNHYQPKVSTLSGRVVGMEALVRWQHPDLGLIYPDAFIPLAEDSGLIDTLTHAVLAGHDGALMHFKNWLDNGLNLHLAVNVSMQSLHDLKFPNVVAQLAQEAGVGMHNLILEITESRLNMDMRSVMDVLTRLRLKRLKLSIDDFGTGYSSLAQLNELPFDELKIDRRFVHQAHLDHALSSILEASINIGKDMGMQTIGEGVETAEDWHHLQRMGCDIAQGYWIAKPLEAAEVLPWLTSWNSKRPDLPGIRNPCITA